MYMRSSFRRRLPLAINTLALVSAGVVLFTPNLDIWRTLDLAMLVFAPGSLPGVTS